MSARRWVGASVALLMLAVPSAWAQSEASALRGTSWRLERVLSMDDAQPPREPGRGRYELVFGLDGRARWRLDCNRATARFEATRSDANPSSGSVVFGALASTRAACGPDSLEPLLLRQLPFVRSWTIQNGRLHLSLLADGGILTWAPLAGAQP